MSSQWLSLLIGYAHAGECPAPIRLWSYRSLGASSWSGGWHLTDRRSRRHCGAAWWPFSSGMGSLWDEPASRPPCGRWESRGSIPGPTSARGLRNTKIYPYLLRPVTAQYPHHIWGIDITYIRLLQGWMYLVAIIDWHSRFVVSWEIDQTLEMPFVLDAADRAFSTASPAIFNSDQGSHFTSDSYLDRLKSRHIQISMDGKGRATDNIFQYDSPRQARERIRDWFIFYNTKRPHQSLDDQTPWEVLSEGEQTKPLGNRTQDRIRFRDSPLS